MAKKNQLTANTTTAYPVTKQGSKPKKVEQTTAKYKEAVELRSHWEPVFQECYDYAMPNRSGFFEQAEGGKNTDDILDSTAVHAVTDFTSRIKSGVIPDGSAWVELQPGSDFKDTDDEKDMAEALEEIQKDVFESLQDSNFSSESDEAVQEMSIGTGFLYAEDGGLDADFKFTAVPITELYINRGPFGRIDEIFRDIIVRAEDVLIRWPDATISQNLQEKIDKEPRKPLKFVEGTCRDYSIKEAITHHHQVIWPDDKHMLWEKDLKGEGASPWIPFRWATGAGETWGRGPLMATLPDVRTVNLTIELILENAEKSLAGMWQTDDDAINPDTIDFVPGTIIPKSPGTSGLEPLEAPGRLEFANLILSDMRENIKRGLFSDPLAREGKTPPTATEAAGQISDLNRRISSPFGRMVNELQKPLVKRLIFLRRAAGKIEIPRLDGKFMKIRPVSPLAKAADMEQILAIDRFLEQVGMRFGPQMVNFIIDAEQTVQLLAKLHGIPAHLARSNTQLKELAGKLADMAGQAQADGPPGGNVQDLLNAA